MENNLPAVQEMQKTWVQSLDREDPLEQEMATGSSTLAWRIPWTEEPGGLQTIESQPLGRGSALPRLGAELELRRSGSSLGPSQ